MFGRGDEIGEGIALVVHAAGIVPGFAEFSAAADVGNSVDHAAIEQAQAIRTEVDWHGNAVAAVTIEQQGRFLVAWRVFSIDARDWDARAIGRRGVQPFAAVERSIVAAEYRLLLAQGALPAAHIKIKN